MGIQYALIKFQGLLERPILGVQLGIQKSQDELRKIRRIVHYR